MSVALTRKTTFIALALALVLVSLVAGVLYFEPWDASRFQSRPVAGFDDGLRSRRTGD